MSIDSSAPVSYTDLAALGELKRQARKAPDAATVREAARQFESLFTKMMLQSMREASMGDSLFDSEQSGFYRDMFDDQLAVDLSRGRGLGLAEMLVQQLMQGAQPASPSVLAPPGMSGSREPANIDARREFVERLMPHARVAAAQLGVEPAQVLAHAALETGWGRSTPVAANGRDSFNLFGIKATGRWAGDSVSAGTQEYENGAVVSRREAFRAYGSAAQSVSDYVQLLTQNPRYREALGTGGDSAAFGAALQRAGYATDPNYAAKLTAVAESVRALLAATPLKSDANPPLTTSQSAGA